MSNIEIKRDWRIRIKVRQKFADVCNNIAPTKLSASCPAKLKVKKLPYGTPQSQLLVWTTRSFDLISLEEQREFVLDCLKIGVTTSRIPLVWIGYIIL